MAKKQLDEQEEAAQESVAVSADDKLERVACTPVPVSADNFNTKAILPYGLALAHVYLAMNEFVDFLGFINQQLNSKRIQRFESMLMPANFSSMVGEFITSTIPKHCATLAKNQYHNGHPDLLPKGRFPGNALQHGAEGIEVKASRYHRGWQGHNAEECWLMVYVFDSNRPSDGAKKISPRPFIFQKVYLAQLTKDDWLFSGRKEGSRRTITASVTRVGFEKLKANWLYHDGGEKH